LSLTSSWFYILFRRRNELRVEWNQFGRDWNEIGNVINEISRYFNFCECVWPNRGGTQKFELTVGHY